MKIVEPDDHIYVDSWEKLAREIGWDYCNVEDAPQLFQSLGPKIRLLSGCSDLGLHRQAEHHPNADLYKLCMSLPFEEMARNRTDYVGATIGPACTAGKCRLTDEFSLKTERFTWATFPTIPHGVWFTTNLNCHHRNVRSLPFGLNTDGPGSSMIPEFAGREKKGILYVNFQNNTVQRVRLKNHYKKAPWVTFRPEANLDVRQYLDELSSHEYALVPPGNGLDSYRVWECLYLGVIPVMERSIFSVKLLELNLPILLTDNLFGLTPDILDEAADQIEWDLTGASLSYWRAVLSEPRWEHYES